MSLTYIRSDFNGPYSGLLAFQGQEYYFLCKEKRIKELQNGGPRQFTLYSLSPEETLSLHQEQAEYEKVMGSRLSRSQGGFKYQSELLVSFKYQIVLNAPMGVEKGSISSDEITNYHVSREI